jgi:phosphatidylglycerophosphate synthase
MRDQAVNDAARYQSYAHLLARMLVRPLIGTRVRPNHLTLLRLATGLAACGLLAVGSRAGAVWSGILWVVSFVLDRADGELARMADLRSETGKVLDFYADVMLGSFWFLSAGIGLRHSVLGENAVALGLISAVSMLVTFWNSDLFERLGPPGVKAFDLRVKRIHSDDGLLLLAPLTWLGWLVPVLVASSICTPMFALAITARYLVKLRKVA